MANTALQALYMLEQQRFANNISKPATQRNTTYSTMALNKLLGSSSLTTKSNIVIGILRRSSLVRVSLQRIWCGVFGFENRYFKLQIYVTGGRSHLACRQPGAVTTGPGLNELIPS